MRVCNLNTDYGKLTKPNHFYYEGTLYQKVLKMTEHHPHDYQPLFPIEPATKRLKGISMFNTENSQQTTHKKKRKISLESRKATSQPSTGKKIHIRLNEVAAYSEQEKRRTESTGKRIQSRIVRVVVPGSSQTKVICYPDRPTCKNN